MALQPSDIQHFLDLWRSLLPSSYAGPILADVGELPAGHAAIWAAAEEALNVSQQAYFLKPHSTQTAPIAAGARAATGAVELRRAAPTSGQIPLVEGTPLEAVEIDSRGEESVLGRFVLASAVTLAEGQSGPVSVAVRAELPGYSGNLPAGKIVRFAEQGRATIAATVASENTLESLAEPGRDVFSPEFVGRLVRLVGVSPSVLVSEDRSDARLVVLANEVQIQISPPLDSSDIGATVLVEVEEIADFGVTVSQPSPTVDGVTGELEAIAADRGQGRVPGETDEAFRARLCALEDTISPAAILRILDRLLGPLGIGYRLIETLDVQGLMGFTWGVHPWGVGGLTPIVKLPGSQLVGQGIVWLQESQYRTFLVLVDTAVPVGFNGGIWGTSAIFFNPNAWGLMPWGGSLLTFNTVIGQLWEALNQARAAGVRFFILQA